MQGWNCMQGDVGLFAAASGQHDGGCRGFVGHGIEISDGVGHIERSTGIVGLPWTGIDAGMVERVPGLRLDCQQIVAGCQIAKLVGTDVIGDCEAGLDDSVTRPVRLEEEHHIGSLHRVASVGRDHSVK